MSFYKSVVHRKDSLKLIIWRFCLFFVSLPGSRYENRFIPRIRIWNTEINHAFAYFWGRNQIISFPSQSFVRFSWQPSDCNINKLLIMSTGTGILLMVNYIKMGCKFFFHWASRHGSKVFVWELRLRLPKIKYFGCSCCGSAQSAWLELLISCCMMALPKVVVAPSRLADSAGESSSPSTDSSSSSDEDSDYEIEDIYQVPIP